MPVYEYECESCRQVFEVQQKISDAPMTMCPECHGHVKKLMSMSSFQLKGGGWYADGYASTSTAPKKETETSKPTAPPCKTGKADSGCAGCSAAATGK